MLWRSALDGPAARDLAAPETLGPPRRARNHWIIHANPPSTFEHTVNQAASQFHVSPTNMKRFKRKAYIPLMHNQNGQPAFFQQLSQRNPSISPADLLDWISYFSGLVTTTISESPLSVSFSLPTFVLVTSLCLVASSPLGLPFTPYPSVCASIYLYHKRAQKRFRIFFFQIVFCSRECSFLGLRARSFLEGRWKDLRWTGRVGKQALCCFFTFSFSACCVVLAGGTPREFTERWDKNGWRWGFGLVWFGGLGDTHIHIISYLCWGILYRVHLALAFLFHSFLLFLVIFFPIFTYICLSTKTIFV